VSQENKTLRKSLKTKGLSLCATFTVAFFFQNCSMNSSLQNKSFAQYEGIANTVTLSSTKPSEKIKKRHN
jgi:hypothetical protein